MSKQEWITAHYQELLNDYREHGLLNAGGFEHFASNRFDEFE